MREVLWVFYERRPSDLLQEKTFDCSVREDLLVFYGRRASGFLWKKSVWYLLGKTFWSSLWEKIFRSSVGKDLQGKDLQVFCETRTWGLLREKILFYERRFSVLQWERIFLFPQVLQWKINFCSSMSEDIRFSMGEDSLVFCKIFKPSMRAEILIFHESTPSGPQWEKTFWSLIGKAFWPSMGEELHFLSEVFCQRRPLALLREKTFRSLIWERGLMIFYIRSLSGLLWGNYVCGKREEIRVFCDREPCGVSLDKTF